MKFESLRGARRYWINGILIALVGIVLTRYIAPRFEPKTTAITKVGGQLTAMTGLLIICIGIKRRTTGSEDSENNKTP